MRLLDSGLQAPYVVEARRKAFEDFVRGKSTSGYPGTGPKDAALCNYGFSDYFGPVNYEKGMYKGLWIMPDGGDNANVLLFPSREEALGYGKTLLSALSLNGYMHSKVYVDAVVVHMSFPTGFFGSLANSEIWDDKDHYVLRIKVRK